MMRVLSNDRGFPFKGKVWVGMVCTLLLACTITSAFAAIDPLPFQDHAEEVRFHNLTKQLRCVVCQNESLNDSSAPLAADLRRDVFNQMRGGKSDAEIKTWLTDRYSDFVLYDPPLRAGTGLLWFGPLLAVLIGAAMVLITVRRRSQAPSGPVPGVRPDSDTEDDW